MDKNILKQLAESVGDFVRGEVSRIEKRLDSLRTDFENLPAPRDGKDGKDGKDGESIVGPEGPAGRDGKDGESIVGPQGPAGKDGKDGETIVGPQGPAGESIQGEKGERGEQGPKGDSIQGEKGDTGEQGPAGLGVDTPLWEERVYREGEEVQHHFGQYFRALKDTAESPDSSDWERIGAAGFRVTGTHSKEFEYRDGDIFIKDFGLFLFKDGEAQCIAGRGPQGKTGKAGPKGRDGRDGCDGVDGKDGSEIDLLELRGSNLVAVFKNADGELKDHAVSLEPFLTTAALVTKEIQNETNKEVIEHADQYVRKLWDSLNTHLDDEDATPISFYRGMWKVDVSYSVGDWVRYGSEGFLCKRAHTGVIPHNYPNSKQDASEYWSSVAGMMTHGVYGQAEGGGGGGDGSGSIGVVPTYALVTEGGSGGTKFSAFSAPVEGEVIKGVGYQDSRGNVQFELTTDAISTNPAVTFRDSKGRFRTTEDYEELTNQLKVNRFMANELEALNGAIEGIEFPEGVDLGPVEERLDGIEAVLPKAPIIIPPIDIGGQTLEVTGSRPTGSGGKAGTVLMWKAEAGGPSTPYNECKLIVPDTSVIDPEVESIWWKQGDKIQRWEMGGAGWFTNSNVLHYSAKETFGDTLVDGQPVELYYIDPETTGDDLIDAISREESKADDAELRELIEGYATVEQLNNLDEASSLADEALNKKIDDESKANTAAHVVLEADIKNTDENSRLRDRNLQADINEIELALESLLLQREAGLWNYIGALADGPPSNEGEFALGSDDLSASDNVLVLNQTDLLEKYHGFGDVTVGCYVEIVDRVKPDEYALFVIDSEPDGSDIVSFNVKLKDKGNNFLIGTHCEIRFFNVKDQDLDLTELDQRYLKLAGGEMKGNLAFGGNHWITYIDGEGQQYIQFKMGSSTSYTGGYNDDDHVATKKRVDAAVEGLASEEWVTEQIEAIPETDLSGLATEEWVTGEINNIDIPDPDLTAYATEEYVDQKVYQSKFIAGQQVAKIGSSSDITGAFWIIDGALYCKV